MLKKAMNLLKSKSAFVTIIMIFLLGCTITPIYAVDVSSNDNYLNAVVLLEKLGIVSEEDEMNYSEETVSRSDFASMLGIFYNINRNSTSNGNSIFSDVDGSASNYLAIETAVKNGALNLVDGNNFKPNKDVTVEQAVKAMVVLLGYDKMYKDNLQSVYLKKASELKLLSEIKTQMSKPITKGELVSLFIRTLDTEVVMAEYGENTKFSTQKGKTLFYERFDVVTVQGVLQATSITGIKKFDACYDGWIILDGNYIKTEQDLNAFLGKYMVAYCIENSDNDLDLLYYFEKPSKNKTLTIDFEDVTKTNSNSLYYSVDRYEKIVKIASDATVIYNGKNDPLYSIGNFMNSEKGKVGTITLLDSDNDNAYETVFIKSYETIWVSRLYNNNGVISLIGDDGISKLDFDTNDDYKTFSFIKNGSSVSYEDIPKNAVVLVAKDKYNEYYEFLISDKVENGIICEYNDDEIKIDDTYYKISRGYDANNYEINVGDVATVYIDAFGNVAVIDYSKSTNEVYGILFRKVTDDLGEYMQGMKIFTADGVQKLFNCADKIKIDGKSYKSEKAAAIEEILKNGKTQFFAKTGLASDGASDVFQLIKYQLNNDGEIVSIDTILENAIPSDDELKFSIKFDSGLNNLRWFDKDYAKTFNGTYVYDNNLVIFALPDDKSEIDAFTVKKGSMNVLGYEHFTGNVPKSMSAFDVEDDVYLPLLMLETEIKESVDLFEVNNIMVFEKLITEVADDGEIYQVMYGTSVNSGGAVKAYMSDDIYKKEFAEKNIKPGDIVRWTNDAFGKVKTIELTVRNEGKDSKMTVGIEPNISVIYDTGYYSTTRLTCGLVEFYNDKYILFKNGTVNSASLINPTAKVLKYDSDMKKTIVGDYSMIRTIKQDEENPSAVVTYQNTSALRSIVILN